MKEKSVLLKINVIFVGLILLSTSISSASASNGFIVNDPLTPEWAPAETEVDYLFEITNNLDSEGSVSGIRIYFPDIGWWLGDTDSCFANDLPAGWNVLYNDTDSVCAYNTNNNEDMIGPGEVLNFIPMALTGSETGIYNWNVQADYTGGGNTPAGQGTTSGVDNTNPSILNPEVYSDNFYFDDITNWVGSPFNLRSQVSDGDSGIDPESCEYIYDLMPTWLDADFADDYCIKTEVVINHLEQIPYKFRVKDNVDNLNVSPWLYLEGDTQPPQTTDNAECGTWHQEDQLVTLSPTDSGSGVQSTLYCLEDAADGECTPNIEGTEVEVTCPEGQTCEQTIRYNSIDNVNNAEGVQESCVIQIDGENPYFNDIVFDPESPSNDNTPQLSFEVIDEDSGINISTLQLLINNVLYNDTIVCAEIINGYTCDLTTTILDEGLNNFELIVNDNAGNQGTAETTYIVDTIPPESEVQPLSQYQTANTFQLNYTFSDSEPSSGFGSLKLWYYSPLDGPTLYTTESENDGIIDFNAVEGDGQYAFFSQGYDMVGNEESWPSSDCTINEVYYQYCPDTWTILDTTNPELSELTIIYPPNQVQVKNGDEITIQARVTDENGINTVLLDASNIGGSETEPMEFIGDDTYSITLTVSGTAGDTDQEVIITALDNSGNSADLSGFVLIDNTPPTINNIIFDPESPSNDATPLLTFDVSDSDSGVNENTIRVEVYSLIYEYIYPANISCNEIESTWSCQIMVDTLEEGNHAFIFYADDHTANTATVQDEYFVDSAGPLVWGISVNPSPAAFDPILAALATDELTNIAEARFYIDFDYSAPYSLSATDGSFDESVELIEGIIDISELEEGVHVVEVQAMDAAGNWGSLVPLTFVVGIPLEEGWNELNLPWFMIEDAILDGNYSVENVLASIDGKYDFVYHFDGENWLSYVPEREINDLLEIHDVEGPPYYWIRMTESGVLRIG